MNWNDAQKALNEGKRVSRKVWDKIFLEPCEEGIKIFLREGDDGMVLDKRETVGLKKFKDFYIKEESNA